MFEFLTRKRNTVPAKRPGTDAEIVWGARRAQSVGSRRYGERIALTRGNLRKWYPELDEASIKSMEAIVNYADADVLDSDRSI